MVVATTPDWPWPKCLEILLFCIRAQTDWETSSQHWTSWILQYIAASQLYCCMIPGSHWTPAVGLVVNVPCFLHPNPFHSVGVCQMLKLNDVEIFSPLGHGSALSAEVDHQNYHGLFTFKLSDNPILCPAVPNLFCAVVDKIMEGATKQMCTSSPRLRIDCKSQHPLRGASCRGSPSEESCAGCRQTWL